MRLSWSERSVRAQYISYSSNSYESTLTNEFDSDAKIAIDTWYQTNIVGKNDSEGNLLTNYIVDGTFCNDRTFASSNTGNGYSLVPYTLYSAFKRLNSDSNKTATLKCSQASDRFSTTTSRGNGDLTYPVALITADEVALAGGKINLKNENFYLQSNSNFYTITPFEFGANSIYSFVYRLNYQGVLEYSNVTIGGGLRPVINIRSDVLIFQGDGTTQNPFILSLA